MNFTINLQSVAPKQETRKFEMIKIVNSILAMNELPRIATAHSMQTLQPFLTASKNTRAKIQTFKGKGLELFPIEMSIELAFYGGNFLFCLVVC